MKAYTSKGGAKQFKPSFEELKDMAHEQQGFCIGCGEVVDGVEPDARRYECEACGAQKVYGAEELATLGLYHE